MIGHKITTKDVFLLLFMKENNLSFQILCILVNELRGSTSNYGKRLHFFKLPNLDRHFHYSLQSKKISISHTFHSLNTSQGPSTKDVRNFQGGRGYPIADVCRFQGGRGLRNADVCIFKKITRTHSPSKISSNLCFQEKDIH